MMNLYPLHTRKICLVLVIFGLSVNMFHVNAMKNSLSDRTNVASYAKDSVNTIVEQMPRFPGGDSALTDYLAHTLRYPEEAIDKHEQGRVLVQIVIDKTGKTTQAKVVKGVYPSLDREALRVVNSLPAWISGKQEGKNVSVYRIIPITFRITSDQNTRDNGILEEIHKAFGLNEKAIVVWGGIQMQKDFELNESNSKNIASIAVIVPSSTQMIAELKAQFRQDAQNGVILITQNTPPLQEDVIKKNNHPILIDNENYIFILASKMPKFPGGFIAMNDFINSHIQYPDSALVHGIDEHVDVRFIVDKTGKVRNVHVDDKVNPLLAAEAIRLVNSFPTWIPGQQNGININALQTLPVEFNNKIDTSSQAVLYTQVENVPKLLKGDMWEFLARNIRYPVEAEENNIQGWVIVQFIINKEGNVENPTIISSPNSLLSQEAIRVTKLMKWTPGKQKGKNVDVKFFLPINFGIN
jgi:TonB family protein